ncbi:hypothetical protein [Nocardia sp. IFM 10818]
MPASQRIAVVLHLDHFEANAKVFMSWLTFVRVLTVDWLETRHCPRPVLRDACVGAALGALAPLQSR